MADLDDLTQNVSLHDEVSDDPVTTTIDGSKLRLDVSIQEDATIVITSDESPTKFSLQSEFDATTGTTLNTSTDDTLASYTGDGVIDFIGVNSPTSSNFEVALEIDGTERFRITMNQLGSILGLANATNVDIWADTANKNFRYHPVQIGFQTSWTLKAKATATPVPKVYFLVLYREKTT